MSEHIETTITETNESVPHASDKPEDIKPARQVKPYDGPIHLDDANQIIPAAKPKARHETEVDADGRKQREEASAAGWPPSALDLTKPLVITPEEKAEAEAEVKSPEPYVHHE